MLDSGRVTSLRLRPLDSERDVLVLDPGVHALAPALLHGRPGVPEAPLAHIYVDSRGVWLQLADGVRGAYVNGRALRRMAMLRAGDSLFLDGVECVLQGRRPGSPTAPVSPLRGSDARVVLRCVAGRHHGRCFPLEAGVTLGRARDSAILLDDDAVAEREVDLRLVADGVLADVSGRAGVVAANGYPITRVLLEPGDQLVVGGQHRFVVEAARPAGARSKAPAAPPERPPAPSVQPQLRRAARRVPWLLFAAALLAGALSLLLLYGAR